MDRVAALLVNYAKRDASLSLPYLQPIIEERHRASIELGDDWNDKPVSYSRSFKP